MNSVSMVGGMLSMVETPEPAFNKEYGDLLLSMCIKVLAQALAALPAFYFSVMPRLRSADSSVADKQASFATGICEAEASGRHTDAPCLASELSNTDDDLNAPEEQSIAICKAYEVAIEGPDMSKRMRRKDISAWFALAKNKDDDDEDDDEEDDDEEDDDDDAADEEGVGDEGEGGEEVEGHGDGGGEDDDDDDDDDDENGKGGDDEEDDEDAVEGEDEEDEDAAEDEEDEEEDDDDDETPEPPQKKRK